MFTVYDETGFPRLTTNSEFEADYMAFIFNGYYKENPDY